MKNLYHGTIDILHDDNGINDFLPYVVGLGDVSPCLKRLGIKYGIIQIKGSIVTPCHCSLKHVYTTSAIPDEL